MRPFALAAVMAAVSVAGCAGPGGCDPSQADFFSGIACESSGQFSARNSQMQSNLASARANLQAERSNRAAAAMDVGAAQAERNRAAAALSGMRRQNASLRSRLDAAGRRDGADRATIARQRVELDQLERDRATAQRSGANEEQLRELSTRQRALADAISGI